jgi:hypothetical protein
MFASDRTPVTADRNSVRFAPPMVGTDHDMIDFLSTWDGFLPWSIKTCHDAFHPTSSSIATARHTITVARPRNGIVDHPVHSNRYQCSST